ncbi:MAG: HD domain-containing protein [Rickettsia endosymbiont of Oxypoda opaca]|nr:HD domain-containing protein [Rickettsia endosymbiont of Oxypoda opaca]
MKDINCWEEKFEICGYAQKRLDKVVSLNSSAKYPVNIKEVKKGLYYARKYHGSQKRQSGEPYYSHPIEVAYMVSDYTANRDARFYTSEMIVISLLHDTIEDTELTKEMIAVIFGEEVAKQVEALTRIKTHSKISSAEMLNLLTIANNEQALIIKFFDRFHNMQTIGAKSPEKQRKTITETLIAFLPVATEIDYELEARLTELCLSTLESSKVPVRSIFSNGNFQLPPLTF